MRLAIMDQHPMLNFDDLMCDVYEDQNYKNDGHGQPENDTTSNSVFMQHEPGGSSISNGDVINGHNGYSSENGYFCSQDSMLNEAAPVLKSSVDTAAKDDVVITPDLLKKEFEVHSLKNEIQRLTNENISLEDRCYESESKLMDFMKAKLQFEEEKNDFYKRVEQWQDALNEKDVLQSELVQYKELVKKYDAEEEELKLAKKEAAKRRAEAMKAKKLANEYKVAAEAAQSENKRLKKRLMEQHNEPVDTTDLLTRCRNLEKTVADLSDRCEKLEAEKADVEEEHERCKYLVETNEQYTRELKVLRELGEIKESEVITLRKELKETNSICSKWQSKVEELKKKIKSKCNCQQVAEPEKKSEPLTHIRVMKQDSFQEHQTLHTDMIVSNQPLKELHKSYDPSFMTVPYDQPLLNETYQQCILVESEEVKSCEQSLSFSPRFRNTQYIDEQVQSELKLLRYLTQQCLSPLPDDSEAWNEDKIADESSESASCDMNAACSSIVVAGVQNVESCEEFVNTNSVLSKTSKAFSDYNNKEADFENSDKVLTSHYVCNSKNNFASKSFSPPSSVQALTCPPKRLKLQTQQTSGNCSEISKRETKDSSNLPWHGKFIKFVPGSTCGLSNSAVEADTSISNESASSCCNRPLPDEEMKEKENSCLKLNADASFDHVTDAKEVPETDVPYQSPSKVNSNKAISKDVKQKKNKNIKCNRKDQLNNSLTDSEKCLLQQQIELPSKLVSDVKNALISRVDSEKAKDMRLKPDFSQDLTQPFTLPSPLQTTNQNLTCPVKNLKLQNMNKTSDGKLHNGIYLGAAKSKVKNSSHLLRHASFVPQSACGPSTSSAKMGTSSFYNKEPSGDAVKENGRKLNSEADFSLVIDPTKVPETDVLSKSAAEMNSNNAMNEEVEQQKKKNLQHDAEGNLNNSLTDSTERLSTDLTCRLVSDVKSAMILNVEGGKAQDMHTKPDACFDFDRNLTETVSPHRSMQTVNQNLTCHIKNMKFQSLNKTSDSKVHNGSYLETSKSEMKHTSYLSCRERVVPESACDLFSSSVVADTNITKTNTSYSHNENALGDEINDNSCLKLNVDFYPVTNSTAVLQTDVPFKSSKVNSNKATSEKVEQKENKIVEPDSDDNLLSDSEGGLCIDLQSEFDYVVKSDMIPNVKVGKEEKSHLKLDICSFDHNVTDTAQVPQTGFSSELLSQAEYRKAGSDYMELEKSMSFEPITDANLATNSDVPQADLLPLFFSNLEDSKATNGKVEQEILANADSDSDPLEITQTGLHSELVCEVKSNEKESMNLKPDINLHWDASAEFQQIDLPFTDISEKKVHNFEICVKGTDNFTKSDQDFVSSYCDASETISLNSDLEGQPGANRICATLSGDKTTCYSFQSRVTDDFKHSTDYISNIPMCVRQKCGEFGSAVAGIRSSSEMLAGVSSKNTEIIPHKEQVESGLQKVVEQTSATGSSVFPNKKVKINETFLQMNLPQPNNRPPIPDSMKSNRKKTSLKKVQKVKRNKQAEKSGRKAVKQKKSQSSAIKKKSLPALKQQCAAKQQRPQHATKRQRPPKKKRPLRATKKQLLQPAVKQQRPQPEVKQQRPQPEVKQQRPQPEVNQQRPQPEVKQQRPHPEVMQQRLHPEVSQQRLQPEISEQRLQPEISEQRQQPEVTQQRPQPAVKLQPATDTGGALYLALERLEQLRYKKILFKKLRHNLQAALINPSIVPSAAFAVNIIVNYLCSSKRNPLMTYSESYDEQVLYPQLECCIVQALLSVEKKQKLHLEGLMQLFLSEVLKAITQNKTLKMYAVSALCRVFTAVYKEMGKIIEPHDLCYNLLKYREDVAHPSIASIAGIWPEVLNSPSGLECVKQAWNFVLLRKPEDLLDGLWKDCLSVFCSLCHLKHNVEKAESEIAAEIFDYLINHDAHDSDGALILDYSITECQRALDLITHQKGWRWSKEVFLQSIVKEAVVEKFKVYSGDRSLYSMKFIIQVIYSVDDLSPEEDHTCISCLTYMMPLFSVSHKDNFSVLEELHFTLLRLHLRHNHELPSWLTDWLTRNTKNISDEYANWILECNKNDLRIS